MLYCWNAVVLGILLTTQVTSGGINTNEYPGTCNQLDEVQFITRKTQPIDFIITHDTEAWKAVLTNSTARWIPGTDSLKCTKTYDFSRLARLNKKNKRLVLDIEISQVGENLCPFNVLLYSENSVEPIESYPCSGPGKNLTVHWPDYQLRIGVSVFESEVLDTNGTAFQYQGYTRLRISGKTCVNCYLMMPSSDLYTIKDLELPEQCQTLQCVGNHPTLIHMASGSTAVFGHNMSQLHTLRSCQVKIVLDGSVLEDACVQVLVENTPLPPGFTLSLLIDSKTFMTFNTTGIDNYWCIPRNWWLSKQARTMTFKWTESFLSFFMGKRWTVNVKLNFAIHPLHSFDCRPFFPTPETSKTTAIVTVTAPTTTAKDVSVTSDHDVVMETISAAESDDNVSVAVVAAVTSTGVFVVVALIIITVCCLVLHKGPRSQRPGSSLVTFQYRNDNRNSYVLTPFDDQDTTSAIPPRDSDLNTNGPSVASDLPPPYPDTDTELPPPTYEDACENDYIVLAQHS